MSANPHANGGLLLQDLTLPDFRDYAIAVPTARDESTPKPTRVLGDFLRDVMKHEPRPATTSASSGRTRPPPTGSAPSSR